LPGLCGFVGRKFLQVVFFLNVVDHIFPDGGKALLGNVGNLFFRSSVAPGDAA